MRLIIFLFVFGINVANAQTLKHNSITVGGNFMHFLDREWAIRPKGLQTDRFDGINTPTLTYTRQIKHGRYLRFSTVHVARNSPYTQRPLPCIIYRHFAQTQITIGKSFRLKHGFIFEGGVGLAYQNYSKSIFIAFIAPEAAVTRANRRTIALPIELRLHRTFWNFLDIGINASHTMALSALKHAHPSFYQSKPDRHILAFAVFAGYTFGKKVE